jgi:hypothetical protein
MFSRPKQYKDHIKKWKLSKNIKQAEMEVIRQKRAERDAKGKKTIFIVRGRVVSDEKIGRYEREGLVTFNAHEDIGIAHVLDAEGNVGFSPLWHLF